MCTNPRISTERPARFENAELLHVACCFRCAPVMKACKTRAFLQLTEQDGADTAERGCGTLSRLIILSFRARAHCVREVAIDRVAQPGCEPGQVSPLSVGLRALPPRAIQLGYGVRLLRPLALLPLRLALPPLRALTRLSYHAKAWTKEAVIHVKLKA